VKRAALLAALLLVVVGTVVVMREATQNRPDVAIEGTATTIDFTVATRGYDRGDQAAATALWAVCSATVDGSISLPEDHHGSWRVAVEPAIGEHGENRLVGCLEDVTIDRVAGDVVAIRSDR